MEKKFKFIVATQKNKEEFVNTPTGISLEKLNLINQSYIIYENSEGLSKVYNSFINEDNRDSFLTFLHDDILLEDVFILEKLKTAFESYDIVGLAGTRQCDLSVPMCAWHLMSDRNNFVGEVAHSKDKKFWTTCFGPTPSRSLIIDGLFISVNTSSLLDRNVRFDEDFTFHHYDISFCLNANKNKLKIGVYPIKLVHFGLGDSMNSNQWNDSNNIFKRKYKNE